MRMYVMSLPFKTWQLTVLPKMWSPRYQRLYKRGKQEFSGFKGRTGEYFEQVNFISLRPQFLLFSAQSL